MHGEQIDSENCENAVRADIFFRFLFEISSLPARASFPENFTELFVCGNTAKNFFKADDTFCLTVKNDKIFGKLNISPSHRNLSERSRTARDR